MPDSGKTGILLETIGLEMKRNEKFVCIWVESENSIDIQMIQNLYKIDIERFFFIAQDKNASAEGIGDLLTNLLSSDDLKPDIIVASQPAASKVLLSDLQITIPVITMSHGDPEDYFHTYPVEELPSLGLSAACQVLIPSYVKAIISRFPNEKVVVIGNVVPQHDCAVDLLKDKDTYKIIFVGRLVKNHKRPHILIKAFAALADEFSEWNVELWGASDDKKYTNELVSIIAKNGLQNRVFIKGLTDDITSVLKEGDILGFPSAYEGFSLALTEAMSVGLPVVGFNSCSGLSEIVEDGVTGFLVDDSIEDFSNKLKYLMQNKELRAKFGRNAHESVKQYASDIIWNAWCDLLNECVIK